MRRTSSGLWVPGAGPPPDDAPYAGAPAGDNPGEAGDDAENGDSLDARLAKAEAEAQEHRQSWLRVLADFENVRRRSAIELGDARDRGRSEVLLPLLGILDDVDRALAAGGVDSAGRAGGSGAVAGDEATDPIRTGLRLIRARLGDLLRTQGVEEIAAAGEPFDPHVHEAVMQIAAPGVPPGHVAQVLSPGYRLGERVLRPAGVAVAQDSSPNPA
jgi:molecular chaperone GrpE